MAYNCPTKLTWKMVKNDTTSSISSCFNNTSMFFFFSNASRQHNKRLHSTTFSIEPSSSSSSCCSTSQANALTRTTYKKSAKNEKGNGGVFSVLQSDKSIALEKKESAEASTKSGQIIKKRPFWRGVLFASKKIKSILLLNVITIVYASDIPVLKAVEEIMDPAAFCAVRFFMSAIPFLPFMFQARDDVKIRNAGIELGLWVSLGYFVEALGLLTSDAGRASFISLFTVIIVPLLDGMLGAIIPASTWFGVLMSALGVGMLECSGSPPNVGDLLNFLSAIFFGIHMLRTERISRSTKKEKFLALLGYEICVVALLSTIWVLVGGWFDGNQDFNQSSWTWTVLWDWMFAFPWVPALYTGVFSTGICLWIEIAAMRDVSATETAIIYGMEPLWGAGFAWFLLGERWGTAGWIGAALVLGGSMLVQMCGSSSADKAEEHNQKGNLLLIPELDKQVVLRSKKDMTNILK
ncbi:Drug/metabolite transporter [Melia azedarach]|uniref:Drug/metabolite transporter n=1 Tax=Melia azedarach TaxID=155640 RepID=A0ACC1XS04_MELAZ|nr:Drug/metabolite transporter [Melia azedarach]